MNLVMKLTSLGHAARNKANRKVRQPLSEAAFAVSTREEASVLLEYADLLEDELNVKTVRSLNSASEAVSYALNPLPKQLGQKYGNRFPDIRKAVLALEPEKYAQSLLAGGYAVGAEGAYLAALVTDLTPELVQEGLAREFVRRVQDLRKTADLEIADRIVLFYTATPGLTEAVKAFADYIQAETLTVVLNAGEIPSDAVSFEDEFDSEKVSIGLKKA
jgi:isoleucyl-tRNA synthetase